MQTFKINVFLNFSLSPERIFEEKGANRLCKIECDLIFN